MDAILATFSNLLIKPTYRWCTYTIKFPFFLICWTLLMCQFNMLYHTFLMCLFDMICSTFLICHYDNKCLYFCSAIQFCSALHFCYAYQNLNFWKIMLVTTLLDFNTTLYIGLLYSISCLNSINFRHSISDVGSENNYK